MPHRFQVLYSVYRIRGPFITHWDALNRTASWSTKNSPPPVIMNLAQHDQLEPVITVDSGVLSSLISFAITDYIYSH